MILGIDLGTTSVKAVVWSGEGPVATGRGRLTTSHPAPDRAEQDPDRWWDAAREAVAHALGSAAARGRTGPGDAGIEALAFSTARQTIVPVDARLRPLRSALVWSDRRAGAQAAHLGGQVAGRSSLPDRTGAALDGAAVAAKLAWLAAEEPGTLEACRWVLGPRDLLAARMTGRVVTDVTVASRSGLYDRAGSAVTELAGPWADRLPPVVAPTEVVGHLSTEAAAALGLAAGIPVVAGAGDRACEVLGSGAGPDQPMVSWGTTANISRPVPRWPEPVPEGTAVSRAPEGYLVEGGLSGAGSLLDWLAALTATDTSALAAEADGIDPGAGGLTVLAWIDGARAPWWRPEAGAGFLGISAAHGRAHLARASYEGVALDLARCLDAMAGADPVQALQLCGAGAGAPPWPGILAAVTGLAVRRRRLEEAGSAGAALLAAAAVGIPLDLERINPVVSEEAPDPSLTAAYAEIRAAHDRAAQAVLGLSRPWP